MYKVKLSFPYDWWDLMRQTPKSSGIWGDYHFYINQEIDECDFWIVYDHLLKSTESVKCPKENIFLITGEPFVIQQYHPSFTDQFARVITCQTEIKHPQVTYSHQGQPWFVGARYKGGGKFSDFSKSYDELMATTLVKKSRNISIITSSRQSTDGHKKRYEFAMAIKDYFGNDIDLFGQGVNNFEDKWDVLADYKYSIAIENCVCPDLITEKLCDCYLAHTFPFYYGCPNVTDYFDAKSFQSIDIQNLDSSKRTIENILNNPSHYDIHLPEILKAKEKYLNNFNIFPLIVSFIENLPQRNNVKLLNTMYNNPLAQMSLPRRAWKKVYYFFHGMAN